MKKKYRHFKGGTFFLLKNFLDLFISWCSHEDPGDHVCLPLEQTYESVCLELETLPCVLGKLVTLLQARA